MKKKKVAKLLALAMAGMMTLSGCGGTGGTDSNTDSASQQEAPRIPIQKRPLTRRTARSRPLPVKKP